MTLDRRRIVQTPLGPKEGILVPIKSAESATTVLKLDDGTEIRMQTVVVEVVRLDDMFDDDGNPTYIARHGTVLTVEAPPELKRKDA